MQGELWVRPIGRLDEVAGAALEAGADRVLVTNDQREAVEGVGRVPLAEIEADEIQLGDRRARIVHIEEPEDQQRASKLLGEVDTLVVAATDWSIIPLENLIAWAGRGSSRAEDEQAAAGDGPPSPSEGAGRPTKLFAQVSTPEEAEVALTTLESGADGLVLVTDEPAIVHEVAGLVDRDAGQLALELAHVTNIETVGMGDRVCVDTTSLLAPEEGLLVGSRSAFLVLVASEASEAGYVSSRPFRVNAGAVHGYALAPDETTHYLSEVQAGVELLGVDREGTTRAVTTGRAKIERRPMLLVEIETEDGEAEGSLVLQNAETIRLVGPEGPISVADLSIGDRVLVHQAHEGGRHFGEAIEETIQEV